MEYPNVISTIIDSVGLSTLVASLTSVRKQGGDLKLVRLPQGVHQSLQIARLVTVFEIHNSLESALQAFDREAVGRTVTSDEQDSEASRQRGDGRRQFRIQDS